MEINMQDKKRKFGIFVAISMLSFFGIVILSTGAIKWMARHQTQVALNSLAEKVASGDRTALMNWAAGNERDKWGNTFNLEMNTGAVQFMSKGPDGVSGTKDDIHSVACVKLIPKYSFSKPEPVKESEPNKPSIVSNSWEWVSNKYKNWREKD
jgi:hypothetical protein